MRRIVLLAFLLATAVVAIWIYQPFQYLVKKTQDPAVLLKRLEAPSTHDAALEDLCDLPASAIVPLFEASQDPARSQKNRDDISTAIDHIAMRQTCRRRSGRPGNSNLGQASGVRDLPQVWSGSPVGCASLRRAAQTRSPSAGGSRFVEGRNRFGLHGSMDSQCLCLRKLYERKNSVGRGCRTVGRCDAGHGKFILSGEPEDERAFGFPRAFAADRASGCLSQSENTGY